MYSAGVKLALCHPHLGQINHSLHNGAPQRKSSQIASDLQPWTGRYRRPELPSSPLPEL